MMVVLMLMVTMMMIVVKVMMMMMMMMTTTTTTANIFRCCDFSVACQRHLVFCCGDDACGECGCADACAAVS